MKNENRDRIKPNTADYSYKKPKAWQYVLGALGLLTSFCIVSMVANPTGLVVVALSGLIVYPLIMTLNYNTGHIIAHLSQKLVRKFSLDEGYEILYSVLIDIIYLTVCVIFALLLKVYSDASSSCTAVEVCRVAPSVAISAICISITILNLTTISASITKLPSYQRKKIKNAKINSIKEKKNNI